MDARPIDVHHLGRDRVICCWHVGDFIVDPGPESSLPTLLDALGDWRPRGILLTHIHLDHAGATGTLARLWPEVEVHVHERGAPHLADPGALLASAQRLYGDQMERLWGAVEPVPARRIHALSGGERIDGLQVAYTPGHASHHVAYFDEESGCAFTGDVAGVRIAGADIVLPPTPPPDIDLEAWNESLSTVAEWSPSQLAITHFGAVERPFEHLAVLRDRLTAWATLARELDAEAFEAHIRQEVTEATDPDTAAALTQAVPPEQQWTGLDRYWRKREEA